MASAEVGRLPGVLQAQLQAARLSRLSGLLRPFPAERRHILWLLLALALVKGLLWSISLPPWYGPDEPAHFEYTQFLATNHHVPSTGDLTDWSVTFPYEVTCSAHNLGFRSNHEFYTQPPWGPDPAACPQRHDPAARIPASQISEAGEYSPFFYTLALPFWEAAASASVETRLHAVRLFSVLLGVIATAFAYLAAVEVFGRRRLWLAEAATALFALNPIESQQTAVVNNDSLLLALAAAIVWRLLVALRRPLQTSDALWLGILIGAAFWNKPQGAFLAAGVVPVMVAARLRGESWRSIAGWVGLVALVSGSLAVLEVVGGSVWRGRVGPHPLLHTPPGPHGVTQWLQMYTDRSFNHVYFLFVVSFWGDLSWLSATLPAPILAAILVAYGLAVLGLVVLALRRRMNAALAAALFTTVAVTAAILLLELIYFRSAGVPILQGRGFLVVWPLLAPALLAGLVALVPRRYGPPVAAVVVLAALAVNCSSLMVLWDSFYG